MAKRAAVYVRISSDPRGEEAGIKRQERDCRELAKSRGWLVAKVYADNDRSGWSGVERPGYQEMLSDVEAGSIDAVVFWKLDRLTRRITEFSEFYKLCERHDVEFVSCKDALDTTSPINVGVVHLLASVGEQESHNTSTRLKRQQEDAARAGRVHSGGKRAFGYERDGITVRRDEAKIVREAARRALRGEGLITIAEDLNRREVATAGGGRWSTRTLKRLLTSPRCAGLREYNGEVVGKADWSAILKEPDYVALRALLLGPSRGNGGTTARKYLLAGFAFCGLCETRMVSRPRRKGAHGFNVRSYACSSQPYGGCGGLSVVADPLEELVREAVISAFDTPGFRDLVSQAVAGGDRDERAALLESIRADEEALAQLSSDYYVDRLIGRSEFIDARKTVEERLGAAKRTLARATKATVLVDLPRGRRAFEKEWDERDLNWRRSLVALALDRVVVHRPEKRGRNFFDPKRVELVWRV